MIPNAPGGRVCLRRQATYDYIEGRGKARETSDVSVSTVKAEPVPGMMSTEAVCTYNNMLLSTLDGSCEAVYQFPSLLQRIPGVRKAQLSIRCVSMIHFSQ